MKITTKLKETEIGLIPEDWEIMKFRIFVIYLQASNFF